MALLYMDGFSHYNNHLDNREQAGASGSISPIVTSGGPYGEPYSNGPNSSGAINFLNWNITNTTTLNQVFLQFHGRAKNNSSQFRMFELISMRDRIDPHIAFHWLTSSNLRVSRGNNTSIVDSVSGTFTENVWHYFEIRAIIAESPLGQIEVKLNGVTIIDTTGVDTSQGGTPNVDMLVRTGTGSNAREFDMANIIVMSTVGTRLNGFLGERRIIGLFPGAGTTDSDWTRSSAGSTNWELVDENPPVYTDYVSADSTGLTDRYDVGNLIVKPNTIDAICVKPHWRVDDWGKNWSPKAIVQVSTDVAESSATFYPTNKGMFETAIFEDDPSAGPGWGIDAIQNMTIGMKT